MVTCSTCNGPLTDHSGNIETLVGYESPPGHDHDDNCVTRVYRCAHGHVNRLSIRRSCSACDWRGRATCFCHGGTPKLDEWPSYNLA